jgi:hypothetical protein
MADKEIVESLNKISSNLADINNTLKKTNNEKVAEPINYDEMVQDLIGKIDNEKSLFTLRDELHGYGMTFYVVGIFLLFAFIISYLPDNIAPFVGRMTLVFAILAVILTFVFFTSRGMENNVVEANFGKAIRKFNIDGKEEEKRLLLLALLKIKAMTPHRKLEIVKKMHKEMFTKEKLLERLYK